MKLKGNESQCTYIVTLRRVRATDITMEKQYSKCVYVTLGVQHMQCTCAILTSVALSCCTAFLHVITYKLEGSRRLRLPYFKTIGSSWYSFVLEAESTPGPWCGRKGFVNEKLRDFPACSAVPQPTALPRATFEKSRWTRKVCIDFLYNFFSGS
jgi:hypothetical protein